MPGLSTLRATLRRTRLLLLRHVDDAEAALADLLQELVRADNGARALADLVFINRGDQASGGRFEETRALIIGLQQSPNPSLDRRLVAADL